MKPAWESSRLDAWKPARRYPETYPGERPPGSYLLLDDFVCPLVDECAGDASVLTPDGDLVSLDGLLERAGLPRLDERVAVLSYGGNRNPATLRIKLSNYGYRCPGTAVALPVLRGTIEAADVAACGLSGQGYLFGDLVIEEGLVDGTRCEVWLALVDPEQMRVLHESEIGTGDYVAARFPGVEVGSILRGEVLGYAAGQPCFVSPEYGQPLAFTSVSATGRSFPELTPMEMLDHVFRALGLLEAVARAAGVAAQRSLARPVAAFLNRNWWRSFSGLEPDPGYGRILRVVADRIAAHALSRSTASLMASRGLAMADADAYNPDASLTWGRL